MATCKDCLHFDVCEYHITELTPMTVAECPNFKDVADVQEVRHGEWILKSELHQLFDDADEEFYVECPFCRRTFYVRFELTEADMLKYAKEQYPYCNCGAKMDGKDDTNEVN